MAIIGCTIGALAVLDAQTGGKVPLRDYFWDKQNPSYVTGLAKARAGMLSWKFRGPGTFPAKDFTGGRYDGDYNVFLDDALGLGMDEPVIVAEHETDAKTALSSGTIAELNDALLHASKLARQHPLWKSSGAKVGVVLTGWKLSDPAHGPAFARALADCDVICLDPYATATATVDAEAGPDVDWIAKNYPDKEVQFGEWGIPTGKPGRSAELAATVATFNSPRYKQLTAAYYWDGGAFTIMGTADQPALVAAIKASLPPDLAAELAAANTQIASLTTQLGTAAASNNAMKAAIAAAAAALAIPIAS